MRSLIAIAVLLIAGVANAQQVESTFGLGPMPGQTVDHVIDGSIESTFGLGGDLAASAAPARARDTIPRVAEVGKRLPKPSDTYAARVVEPKVSFQTTQVITRSAPYSSPPGYHRHVLVDGSIIEHHDSNFGDPIAHAGVAGRNWPKYYGPEPPTTVSRGVNVSTCPGGVCPTSSPVRRGLFRRR